MERKDIHEMIAMLMESLREQTQTLASYEGRIPQIELDIVMSNLRKVYDYCSKLNLLNQGMGLVRMGHDEVIVQPSTPKTYALNQPPAMQVKATEPVSDHRHEAPGSVAGSSDVAIQHAPGSMPEIVKQAEPEPMPDSKYSAHSVPVEYSVPEQKIVVEQPVVERVAPVAAIVDVPTEESVSVPEVPTKILTGPDHEDLGRPNAPVGASLFSDPAPVRPPAVKMEQKATRPHDPDLFTTGAPILAETLMTDSKPSVADRFADRQTDQNLASRLGQKTIGDMKEAIGINDKFLLINELFKGNQHHYNQALQFLNYAESFDEAMGMFSRMFAELKWKDDSKAVGKLRSLIERRHGGQG